MKFQYLQSIIFSVFFVFGMNNCLSGQDYLLKKLTNICEQINQIQLKEKVLEEEFKEVYVQLSSLFCGVRLEQEEVYPISSDSIFSILFSKKNLYQKEYFQFLRTRINCLSIDQYKMVRKGLLNFSFDELEVDIIGLFKLTPFEANLKNKIILGWSERFLNTLNKTYKIDRKTAEELEVYLALANLGDKKIEDEIISVLNAHVSFIEEIKGTESRSYRLRLNFFHREVLGPTLKNIHTKTSLIKSLNFMENYEKAYLGDDVSTLSMYGYYLENVVLPKLDIAIKDSFRYKYLYPISLMTKEEKEENLMNLQRLILNDEIGWSEIIDYKEKDNK